MRENLAAPCIASTTTEIRVENGKAESFKNSKRVRQGCILSPYLFKTHAEFVMLEAIEDTDSMSIQVSLMSNLRYADDTALMSKAGDELQQMVSRVAEASNRHGLHLTVGKNKDLGSRRN